jgi:hypothetical protein
MMAANLSAKAQDITITLLPGWTWISYPKVEAMDIPTALGDFVPMEGDIIKSQFSSTSYTNGQWRGRLMQFTPGMGYHYYSMRGEPVSFVFASTAPQLTVTTAEPTEITVTSAISGGTITSNDGNYIVYMKGICWATHPNPMVMNDSYTENGSGAESFAAEMTDLTPNTVYYVRAYVVTLNGTFYGDEFSFTTLDDGSNDHAYVDLGLPSGLLWANCNVGADSPEDYGDYFAWGETQPKDNFSWANYQYCMGSFNTLTKYCNNPDIGYNGFTDDLTTLEPSDDAATANWGDDWRMPTEEEWQELYQNTTVTWTTRNGVNGRLFTASNGNSLFLPASGYRNESTPEATGIIGDYWTNSLDTDYPSGALSFFFNSSNYYISFCNRLYGRNVRAVRSESQNNTPTGAIGGKFTVNANGDQVYFSQGNLQYQASTNTWKFAENQYDYVGSTNINISSTYSGWIDLFGWGTSGYNHGANCYQPWSTSTNDANYLAYGDASYNLYDQTGEADWGYNPISNGGNQTNQWRTLTQPEWNYVFNTRTTTSGIRYAKANVNNVNGVILLPDDWSTSTYSLSNTNSGDASFSSNTLTASQWSTLEQAGAVFLPAAGGRNGTSGTSVGGVGSYGYYCSASSGAGGNGSGASFASFCDSYLRANTNSNGYRYCGRSVRLVCVAE